MIRQVMGLYLQPEKCRRRLETGEVITCDFCDENCPSALRHHCKFWLDSQNKKMLEEGGHP